MRQLFISISCLLLLGIHSMVAQNVYVLSAGVADYPDYYRDLDLCAKDARAIVRLYRKNAKANTVLLTDSNATTKRILKAGRTLFKKAKPEDIVILYFSGHGFPGGFCAYDDSLTYQEVRSLVASCKARNKMVFADACFSGDLREGSSSRNQDIDSHVMLFLSSRSYETSLEFGSTMRNGLFTACLVRALKGGADTNHDRIITARELFDAVSKSVSEESDDTQHPVMWGNFEDTMPVMVW